METTLKYFILLATCSLFGCYVGEFPYDYCEPGTFCCPKGQTYCEDRCVSTSIDGSNCGACGVVCGTFEDCVRGICIDPATDPGGSNDSSPAKVENPVVQIAIGYDYFCARKENGDTACDSALTSASQEFLRERKSKWVDVTEQRICWVDLSGTAICESEDNRGITAESASGNFATVVATYPNFPVCGLDQASVVNCQGGDVSPPPVPPPTTPFVELKYAGSSTICGLLPNGGIDCFDLTDLSSASDRWERYYLDLIPATAITTTMRDACTLSPQGSVGCYNAEFDGVDSNKEYEKYDAARRWGCGIDDVGRLHCWSSPDGPKLDWLTPGDELYSEIKISGGRACAITVAGRLMCWAMSEDLMVTIPTGW